MKLKTNTFLEFLKVKYYQCFESSIQDFFDNNKDFILKRLDYANYVTEIEIENLDFKCVWIDDRLGDAINFDVAIDVELSLTIGYGRHHDEKTIEFHIWVLACCSANLSQGLENFKIDGVEEYSKTKPKKPLSGNLVPIISRTQFSEYAEDILSKYYPEALESPSPININELATRIGLTVFHRKMSKDNSIFGQLFFSKTKVSLFSKKENDWKEYWVNANSIIVDKEVNSLYSYGSYKMTIAHECIHFVLHKKAFLFSQIFHKNLKLIQCEVKGGIKGFNNDSSSKWMEIQANGIAPYLLLPTKTFKEKVKEVLNRYQCFSNIDLLNNIEAIVTNLAEFYGVTKDAIRKRMTDIGYEEASGAFNFIDGNYVRPYKYPKKALQDQRIYTIPANEIKYIMLSNKELRQEIEAGRYIYVESHLVANYPKYIRKNNLGKIELTDYARENIDECCLSFRIEYQTSQERSNDFLAIFYLNKDIKTSFEYRIVFHDGYENSRSEERRNAYYQKALKEEQEFFLTLTQSFTDCLKKLKAWRDVSNDWIASKIYMDVKTVERTLSGETKPSIQTLCLILLALKTPYSISEHIISLAPNQFDNSNEEHWHLKQLLQLCFGMEMDQVRIEASKLKINL